MDVIGIEQPGNAASRAVWMPTTSAIFLKAMLDHDLWLARDAARGLSVFAVRIDDYHALAASLSADVLEATMDHLAARLRECLRPADTLVRSAEDRFTIIHSFAGDPQALHANARTMLKRLQAPVSLGHHDRAMAASIGIAFYPEDGHTSDLLLERAEDALQRTNRWGGNGFCFHSRSAARKLARDLAWQEDLRRALKAGDLAMRFQPVLDLSRNCMISVSADVFLHDSKRLSIAATEIAETAEAAGLIPALNERLVLAICRQLVDWREAAIDRPISMEMSRAQLLDEQLVRLLSARFRDSGLHADRLELRLDHGMLWDETDHRLRTVLQHLSDLGVVLSASGVGEGQVAFGDLGRLPITSVDLAPEMAATIGRCRRAERVLRGLIAFMHDLGLRVRAVGICSREQLDFLQHHRCDEVAGPLFAPAMEGQDIDRMTSFKPCFRRRDKPSLSASRIVSMH